jgi:hypothetical protein
MAPKKQPAKKKKAGFGAALADAPKSSKKVSSPDKLRAAVRDSQQGNHVPDADEDNDAILNALLARMSAAPPAASAPGGSGAGNDTDTVSNATETSAAGSALAAKRVLDGKASVADSATNAPAATAPSAAAPSFAAAPAADASSATTPVTTTSSNPDTAELLETLKKARKVIADEQKLMTTMVVTTQTLEQIAQVQPTSADQLAALDGMGPTRTARYGEPLLECVRKHHEALGAAGSGNERASSSGSCSSAAPSAAAPAAAEGEAAAAPPTEAMVTVRYSHYKDKFRIVDGRLDFRTVDDKYAISYVFKGLFCCRLATDAKGDGSFGPTGGTLSFLVDDEGGRVAGGEFAGLQPDHEYFLLVDEDPEHAEEKGVPYKAPSSKSGGRGRGGTSSITAELKRMSAEQLRAASSGGEGAAKYRALLEARDLEDAMRDDEDDWDDDSAMVLGEDKASCSCLFGNPCASNSNCKDWKNRFEVARRNGWKGF